MVVLMPISILESVVAVGAASLVSVLTNHTFIQPADLFDTSELHHDQIVALLGVLGIVGAVWAELRLRRATRSKRFAAHA